MVIGLLLACPRVNAPMDSDSSAAVQWDSCGEWDSSDVLGASWTWAWDDEQDWDVGWTTEVVDRLDTAAGQRFVVKTEGVSSQPGTESYTWLLESHVGCADGWVTRHWSHNETHIVYADGSAQNDVYDVEYDGGYALLPMDLTVGDTFTTGGKRRFLVDGEIFLEDEKTRDWEVLEESSVTVPGGAFTTLRASDGEGVVHIAQGAGFVRWEDFSWLVSVEGL